MQEQPLFDLENDMMVEKHDINDLELVESISIPKSYSPVKRQYNECGDLCKSILHSNKRICPSHPDSCDLSKPIRHDPLFGDIYPSLHKDSFFIFSKKHLENPYLSVSF